MKLRTRINHAALYLNRQGRLRKYLTIASAVFTLAAAGTLMNSTRTVARAGGPAEMGTGPSVTIDPTQLPLPVGGSVTVSGTVSAKQSGPWNVGLAGTPTFGLAPGATVTVGNPNTQPVQGADVEKLARVPYESTAIAANCPAPGNVGACFFNFSAVPSGYRLVVENLAGYYQISPGTTAAVVGYIEGTAFRIKGSFTAPVGQIDLGGHIQAAFSNPTRFYVDPGEGVFAVASSTWSNGNSEMVMSGYLEACSITGCPDVQH